MNKELPCDQASVLPGRVRGMVVRNVLPILFVLLSAGVSARAGDALYFTFQDATDLPANPSSILIQSPSFLDVPAGAVLKVHLMRGDVRLSTSTLTFAQAVSSAALLPARQFASFVPQTETNVQGEVLPGVTLVAGNADLNAVTQAPLQYRFLWELSAGVMGTPSRTVITGPREMFVIKFLDLKLCAVSAASKLDDQKPGSLLFFTRYTSSASNAARENTQLSLTNTNPGTSALVRLFLVNSSTCEVSNFTLCLAAQQTVSFALSDLDPGVKGYIMAVATDAGGRPTDFNWLIGQAVVKQPLGGRNVSALLKAYTVAKRKEGIVTADGNNQAEMIFDNVNYDRLPAQLGFDGVPTQLNGLNTTQLSLFRPLANFAGSGSSTNLQITGFGTGASNQVVSTSGTTPLSCLTDVNIGSLRLAPLTVSNLIQPGNFAWFSVSTTELLPLLGTQLTSGEVNGGTTARVLSYSTEYRIKIPVSSAACP
ncbi:MAG: hypothetical protein HYR56_17265 [Acidobacteria bacterium]|nr:hypothetical protein [Acidobacteriota bacterium]MBI3423818.1 hypothetical protein [Acidobacteriota bacterium]